MKTIAESPSGVGLAEITDEERERVFTQVDKDKGGSIDAVELTDALGTEEVVEVVRAALTAAAEDYGMRSLFTQMDEDGNGELDAEEFIAAVRSLLLAACSLLLAVFQ